MQKWLRGWVFGGGGVGVEAPSARSTRHLGTAATSRQRGGGVLGWAGPGRAGPTHARTHTERNARTNE